MVVAKKLLGSLALVALVLMGVQIDGCAFTLVTVEVPDFETNAVEGLVMHRLDEASGEFEPTAEIELLGTFVEDGVEYVSYRPLDGGELHGQDLYSKVQRTAGEGLTMRLAFTPPLPGQFKVSSFNAVGESPLSLETVTF